MCGEAGDVPMAGVTAGARSKAGRTEAGLVNRKRSFT